MNREELIEAARLAYVSQWEAENIRIGDTGNHNRSRAGIVAALAVFEQAHTPTGDEREELIDVMVMTKLSDYAATDMSTIHQAVDAILAAGFRRTVSPEPSATVLAEVREHAERWANRPPTSPYAMGLRDAWRTILRRIDGLAAGESNARALHRAEPQGEPTDDEREDAKGGQVRAVERIIQRGDGEPRAAAEEGKNRHD